MPDLIKPLNDLLAHARMTLEGATSAAEVLEAKQRAGIAYDQAKAAERLAQARGAHDAILATCRTLAGDALKIEARAKVRLADEYDSAQASGDVKKRGNKSGNSNIPHRNITPTVTDIGLTSKQIHDARQVRDAEKAEPGVVKKTIEKAVKEKRAPSHADVKRAVDEVNARRKPKPKQRTRAETAPRSVERENRVAVLMDMGKSAQEIAAELGVVTRAANQYMEHVTIRREAEAQIDPATMPLKAQQKLATAIRQATYRLEVEIEKRVREENLEWIKRQLDQYNENARHHEAVLAGRKGLMKKAEYRSILSCLHPDRVQDEALKKRYEQAFHLFTRLEKLLLDEKESPTPPSGLPKTVEELLRRKAQFQAERAAKRAGRSQTVARR